MILSIRDDVLCFGVGIGYMALVLGTMGQFVPVIVAGGVTLAISVIVLAAK